MCTIYGSSKTGTGTGIAEFKQALKIVLKGNALLLFLSQEKVLHLKTDVCLL